MSFNRSISFSQEPFKERRNQPSSSVAGATGATWSCGTVGRCRTCGAFDSQCSCRPAHLDPAVRAQNVKAFLASTPFEKAKAQRQQAAMRENVIHEETRVRARISALSFSAFEALTREKIAQHEFAHIATCAGDSMEDVAMEEHHARIRLVQAHRYAIPMLNVCASQHVERLGIICTEERHYRGILHAFQRSEDARDVCECETTRRLAMCEAEIQRRGTLWAMYQQTHERVELFGAEVRELMQMDALLRQDIVDAYDAGRARLLEYFDQGSDLVSRWMLERQQVLSQAETQFKQVVREHADFVAAFIEHAHQVAEECDERDRQHQHRIWSLVRFEVKQRSALEHEELEDKGLLHAEMVQGADSIVHTMAERSNARRALLKEAEAHLVHTGHSCLDVLAEVIHLESTERDLRLKWVLQRRTAVQTVHDEAMDALHLEYDDFLHDLRVLWDAMIHEAVDIEHWIEEKLQGQEDYAAECVQAFVACGEACMAEQINMRRQLFDRMVDEENALYDWMDARYAERNSAAAHEMDNRRILEGQEESRRNALARLSQDHLDEMERRHRQNVAALEGVWASADCSLESLWYDEAAGWDLLCTLFDQSWYLSYDRQTFRERTSLCREEETQRRALELERMRLHQHCLQMLTLELRELDRHAHEVFLEAAAAMEAEESALRSSLMQTYNSRWSLILIDAAKDREISVENELLRVTEELKLRQRALSEDDRLYDPYEAPLSESNMNLLEFRRSVHLDMAHLPAMMEGRRSCGGVPAGQWDDSEFKREFLSSVLGGYNTSRLPRTLVDVLSAIYDQVNETKSLKQTQLQDAQRADDAVQKETERVRRQIAAQKECSEEYEMRIKRAESESRTKQQQHKERLAKLEEAIHRNERNLDDILKRKADILELTEQRKDIERGLPRDLPLPPPRR